MSLADELVERYLLCSAKFDTALITRQRIIPQSRFELRCHHFASKRATQTKCASKACTIKIPREANLFPADEGLCCVHHTFIDF